MTRAKSILLALAVSTGLGFGCSDAPEDFEYLRGGGAYFCCDASGACFYTSNGECEPGELLGWCPITTQGPSGEILCKDWGA